MIPTRTLRLDIGTPETAWCDKCMKSTGFVVGLHLVGDDGVSPMGRITGCLEADRHE